MKKIYQTPVAKAITFATEDCLLSSSNLSDDGSDNIDITLSDSKYDGIFCSNQWSAENWANED